MILISEGRFYRIGAEGVEEMLQGEDWEVLEKFLLAFACRENRLSLEERTISRVGGMVVVLRKIDASTAGDITYRWEEDFEHSCG